MNKNLKFIVYVASIAWLVYTLTTLPNTTEALTNGIITAIVSLLNMVINDLNIVNIHSFRTNNWIFTISRNPEMFESHGFLL